MKVDFGMEPLWRMGHNPKVDVDVEASRAKNFLNELEEDDEFQKLRKEIPDDVMEISARRFGFDAPSYLLWIGRPKDRLSKFSLRFDAKAVEKWYDRQQLVAKAIGLIRNFASEVRGEPIKLFDSGTPPTPTRKMPKSTHGEPLFHPFWKGTKLRLVDCTPCHKNPFKKKS